MAWHPQGLDIPGDASHVGGGTVFLAWHTRARLALGVRAWKRGSSNPSWHSRTWPAQCRPFMGVGFYLLCPVASGTGWAWGAQA